MEKTKDSIFKRVFSVKYFMVRFIKDFVDEEWVKYVTEDNIEQMPNEYVKLIGGNLQNDIVYKVQIDDKEAYIYFMLEHQSRVNFLMPFRILEYMTRIWRKYVDDNRKESKNKGFLLPPIYPVVFYDGIHKWTADTEFENKVKYKEMFLEHIPRFKYGLVNLQNIDFDKINEMADGLAVILAVDKVKKPGELSKVKLLKEEFWEEFKKVEGIPEILEIIGEVIGELLTKINEDKDTKEKIIARVKKGEVREMLEMVEEYDVQETRRIARLEGMSIGEKQGIQKEKKDIAKKLIMQGISNDIIVSATGLSIEEIEDIKTNMRN